MPAFVSHMLLGDELFSRLDNSQKERISQCPAAYSWGLIGPDVLFFRKSTSYAGTAIHKSRPSDVFEEMSRYIMSVTNEWEHNLLCSYMFGFIGHYRLDSIAHPFVYSTGRCDAGKTADRSRGGAHHRIEADIDSALFNYKTGGYVTSLKLKNSFDISKAEAFVIASMYASVLSGFYGLPLHPNDIAPAFSNAIKTETILLDSTDCMVYGITSFIDLFRKASPYSAHVVRRQVHYDVLNLSGMPWLDSDNSIKTHSFLVLFEEAAKLSVVDASEMCGKYELNQLYTPMFTSGFDNGAILQKI